MSSEETRWFWVVIVLLLLIAMGIGLLVDAGLKGVQ
jgi:hypothetical protein